MKVDHRWTELGLPEGFFDERAAWLCASRSLHSNALRFFEVAGSLVRLARYDYLLGSVAFFHTLPGLERALKLHYQQEGESLSEMLVKAVSDGTIHDGLFGDVPPFTGRFENMARKLIGKGKRTHSERLAKLLPELRNQYFHGIYLVAPDYLHLTVKVRQIADALKTKRMD